MTPDLPQLRAEISKSPLIATVVHVCCESRRSLLVTLEWCEKALERRAEGRFKELVLAFRALEAAGFGRLLQPTQRARARFQWAVLPLALDTALQNAGGTILPRDLLPAAARMGIALPPPPREGPERPGWTRHALTLRPGATADFLLPDDLSDLETEWLAGFFKRLVQERKARKEGGQTPARDEPGAN